MTTESAVRGSVRLRRGRVKEVRPSRGVPSLQELVVEVSGATADALNYVELTGPARSGDEVMLNTTALDLGLGTGGQHFVTHVFGVDSMDAPGPGHIMKLRYTPLQVRCLAVEEEESPWHEVLAAADSIGGMPVVVAGLHSMVPAIAAAIKLGAPAAKVAYVMTDGAALPVALSRLVPQMKRASLIEACITAGHSFGGDFEAVNVWSALLAARHVVSATHCIVAMGPGIVGTGTPYGFSGMEQADALSAAHCLGGKPIATLRMSFADLRARHRGVSHHSLTILGRATLVRATVPVPALSCEQGTLVRSQLDESGVSRKHHMVWGVDGSAALELAAESGLRLSTMGRPVEQEMAFFLSAAAAGCAACRAT